MVKRVGVVAATLGIVLLWALRPVCVPLSAHDLTQFNVPIEGRDDRDLYLRVFQHRDDGWYQCKTWLSRQFFF